MSAAGPSWRRGLGHLAGWGAFVLILLMVLGAVAPDGWLTGNVEHFPFQLALAWGLLALAFAVARWRRAGGFALALTLVFAVWWASPRWPQSQPELAEAAPLRVVWANLQHRPQAVATLLEWVDGLQPPVQVLGLAEVHDRASLAAVRSRFPHGLADPDTGVALYSRLPLEDRGSLLQLRARPVLRVVIRVAGQAVEVYAAHAQVPFGVGARECLSSVERALQTRPGSVEDPVPVAATVLLGDLNSTPWAGAFRRLLRVSGLRDARRGSWPRATWRAAPWPGFGLPIDHVLLGGEVAVRSLELGPPTGSDHRPLLADLDCGRQH